MTAKQVQLRRDTATNLNAATPAAGELGFDTTNERLVVGNGTAAGGVRHASAKDVQNSAFNYVTAGGTANAITLTMSPVPAPYTAGQEFKFKASATNTGATTVNVNTLGTKNIYKLSNGSLVALSGSEIVSGVIYTIQCDGTQFQLKGSGGAGFTVVQQIFTANGTYTPTAGMQFCIVEAVAAGGGADTTSPGNGGGGGEYVRSRLTAAQIGASKTVTIGTSAINADGTDTSLGVLVVAKGGAKGSASSADGGTGGTGDFKIPGQRGGIPVGAISGPGGNSFFGYGGRGVAATASGVNGSGYGSGGSGRNGIGSGGSGADGVMIVTEYCSG